MPSIELTDQNAIHDPLWYHKRGLMQTASGYGRKLTTPYKIQHEGRKYRIYCCIFSNSGTLYIRKGGEDVIVNDFREGGTS